MKPGLMVQIATAALFGVALPSQSSAAQSAPPPNPMVLAMMDGMLKMCGALDDAVVANLQQQVAQVAQGASDEELAQVRGSREYQQAMQSMADTAANSDEQATRKACGLPPASH